MSTTTTITLTEEQRRQLAESLRLEYSRVPSTLGIVSVTPAAGRNMGVPEEMDHQFTPALLIT